MRTVKNLVHVALLLLICTGATAQTSSIELKIKVLDHKLQPYPNIPVTFTESSTGEVITKQSDGSGMVIITIDKGKKWTVDVGDMKDYLSVELPQQGKRQQSATITYDPEQFKEDRKPKVDRRKLKIEKEEQTVTGDQRPSDGKSIVKVHVVRKNGEPLANYPVRLTCITLLKTYSTKTNSYGIALFMVPNSNVYEVDIDKTDDYKEVEVPNYSGIQGIKFQFEPTNIKEIEKNDTIRQVLAKDQEATSGRILMKMQVRNLAQEMQSNENVYIQSLKDNKVYTNKTNKQGETEFLLPMGDKYMVHFDFERDVDVVNLANSKGIGTGNMMLVYRPKPELQYPERYIPGPQELFVEEFDNFINKQVPDPKPGNTLGIYLQWGNEQVNAQSKESVLEIGFSCAKEQKKNAGPPLNLSFVIDRSGSMEGHDRIESVKESLAKYVKKLRSEDIVSIVVFDNVNKVLVPSQKVGNASALVKAIESIEAGGGTTIGPGLKDGFEEVLKHYMKGGTNRVILFSDGFGDDNVDDIVQMAKSYTAKGIEVSGVGIGQDYNQALISQLVTVGGGLLHYAGEAKDIDKVFAKELNSILNPVAKDVRVEIEYNNQVIYKQLYGFPTQKKTDNSVEMKMDNIYAGLNKLAFVKFDLPKPTAEIEKAPVIVRMSYYDYVTQKNVSIEEKAYLKWSPATGELELLIDKQEKKVYCIAIMNQALKVMAEAFAAKDNAKAKKTIENAIAQVKKLYPNAKDEDVQKLVGRLEVYVKAFTQIDKNVKLGKG